MAIHELPCVENDFLGRRRSRAPPPQAVADPLGGVALLARNVPIPLRDLVAHRQERLGFRLGRG